MNPNLVDSKLFEYDLKKIDTLNFQKNSFILNLVLLALFAVFMLLTIFFVKDNPSKREKDKKIKDKLKYIFDKSNSIIRYNYKIDI
jgi:Na+/H+ antiporter NhaD/arsenite permease-like protein